MQNPTAMSAADSAVPTSVTVSADSHTRPPAIRSASTRSGSAYPCGTVTMNREAGRSGKVTGPYQVQTVGRVVATDMQLKFWPNKMPGTRDPPAPRREELSRQ